MTSAEALAIESPASFDIVTAATAIHWIDPAVRYRRAHELLRDGGVVDVPADPDCAVAEREPAGCPALGDQDPRLQAAGLEGRQRALGEYLGADQLADRCDLRPCGLVAGPPLIGQDRHLDPLPATEVCSVPGGELSDQREAGARRPKLLPGAVQLDRVRLAINSAVVA